MKFFNFLILATSVVVMANAQSYQYPSYAQYPASNHYGGYQNNHYAAHYPSEYGSGYQGHYGSQKQYGGQLHAALYPHQAQYGAQHYGGSQLQGAQYGTSYRQPMMMMRSAETIPVGHSYHHKSYVMPKSYMMANPMMLGGSGLGGLYPLPSATMALTSAMPVSSSLMLGGVSPSYGTYYGGLGYGGLGYGGLGLGGLGYGGLGSNLYAKSGSNAAEHREHKEGFQGRSYSGGHSYQPVSHQYGYGMSGYGHGAGMSGYGHGVSHVYSQPSMVQSGVGYYSGMGAHHVSSPVYGSPKSEMKKVK